MLSATDSREVVKVLRDTVFGVFMKCVDHKKNIFEHQLSPFNCVQTDIRVFAAEFHGIDTLEM